ncbi:AMP-binding protein [Roseofilum capinflatum]|uniref:AMP-binding protein n=1 Tax=Roseofilum capinflatum BLCC-M114 TaxID=3022440 RepID=A0ABT7BBH5_9CYAN|nr:AMP-binding protein [Roseofilum capinflatum]MDJ1176534.1 AMP-binding protein [Roseofilum capinflatum BLCC-M114]
MNIAHRLQERLQEPCTQSGDRPAIITQKQSISFAQLDRASSCGAAYLQDLGLNPGDRVLVFLPMSIDLYIALLAVFKLGIIAMFVDPSAGQTHLENCCEIAPPQALLATPKASLLLLKSPALRQIPLKLVPHISLPGLKNWYRFRAYSPSPTLYPATAETPALLTFTSGSTGKPKAALRSHGFLLTQHEVLARHLHHEPGAIDLTTLPVFILANLASGVTSLIPAGDLRKPGFINPVPIVRQIQTHQPSSTVASPAFLERLVSYCEDHQIRLESFQCMFTGGAPVFPSLCDRLQHCATHAQIIPMYGSTEAEPIAHTSTSLSNPTSAPSSLGGLFAGHPIAEINLKIIPDSWGKPIAPLTPEAFADYTLPPLTPGEIVVSGDHVLPGYVNGEGDLETKFRVGNTPWHRTGDAGYLDSDGNLWLLGRTRAKIEDEKGILYPLSVEAIAHQFSTIKRAALISHNHQRWLILELNPLHPPDEHQFSQLKSALEFAQIDKIKIVTKIPVDARHNAKINYPALEKLLEMTIEGRASK